MSVRRIDATEQAKIMRKVLRESFPGVKFRVRTDKYTGGASIRVSWVDGPNEKQVDAITRGFAGGGFDGMIDYKYTVRRYWKGEEVSFGADFVFTDREYSPEFVEKFARRACEKTGANPEALRFHPRKDGTMGVQYDTHDFSTMQHFLAAFERYSLTPTQASETLKGLGSYSYSPDHQAVWEGIAQNQERR